VEPSWAALRPVLLAFLIAANTFTVASLAVVRPHGWLPPFVAFAIALVGLAGLEVWALRHRRDDERRAKKNGLDPARGGEPTSRDTRGSRRLDHGPRMRP
jgi:Flp pilus assembly protein TadB